MNDTESRDAAAPSYSGRSGYAIGRHKAGGKQRG